MSVSSTEVDIMGSYASDKKLVADVASTHAATITNLSKSLRYLRSQMLQIMQAHQLTSTAVQVDGIRFVVSVVQKKRQLPPSGAGMMEILKSIGYDESNLRVAQLKANGNSYSSTDVVMSLVEDKMKHVFSKSTNDIKISTANAEQFDVFQFTDYEQKIVGDILRVQDLLSQTKKLRKDLTKEAEERLKTSSTRIQEIIARTGPIIVPFDDYNLVFEQRRTTAMKPLKGDTMNAFVSNLIVDIVPEIKKQGLKNTLLSIQSSSNLNTFAKRFQQAVEDNVEEKEEFTFCMYPQK